MLRDVFLFMSTLIM
jgi:hypothetical protein